MAKRECVFMCVSTDKRERIKFSQAERRLIKRAGIIRHRGAVLLLPWEDIKIAKLRANACQFFLLCYTVRITRACMNMCVVRGDCVCGIHAGEYSSRSKQVCCWLIKKSRSTFSNTPDEIQFTCGYEVQIFAPSMRSKHRVCAKEKIGQVLCDSSRGQMISYHQHFCVENGKRKCLNSNTCAKFCLSLGSF